MLLLRSLYIHIFEVLCLYIYYLRRGFIGGKNRAIDETKFGGRRQRPISLWSSSCCHGCGYVDIIYICTFVVDRIIFKSIIAVYMYVYILFYVYRYELTIYIYIYMILGAHVHHHQRKHMKNNQMANHRSECWFCLSTPDVEMHLIVR
jgi:hypothetical protein